MSGQAWRRRSARHRRSGVTGTSTWAVHPEHVEAKMKGRKDFYLEYRVQVCLLQRESAYPK